MPRASRFDKEERAASRARGIEKHLSGLAELWPGSTPQAVVKRLREHVQALQALATAEAAHRAAVARERRVARSIQPLLRQLDTYILGTFEDPRELAAFGLKPPKKPGPKRVEVKLAMVEKAAATRVARGTLGKRQRKKVKG